MGTIKDKYEVATKSALTYARPYTARIDSLKMSASYQPPKFKQFDGKGSPKQHVAHFIETCNNAGTYGDYLIKQFVCSLKGHAFDWYTDLESGSIDSWEQMEQEFLNHFYSTRRTVSMVELTNTRQRIDDPRIQRRPWVHENKVISSTYHQFLKYYEDGVAKKIIADNNPFTEAEAHFADAKFYLKKYATKIDDIASKDDEILNKKSKVGVDKAKVVSKEDPKLGISNKTPNMNNVFPSKKARRILYYVPKSKKDDDHSLKLQENALGGLTFLVKQIDVMNSSPKSLGKFMALKSSQNEALPMRRTYEGFDPNAYILLAKAGYNPTEPSKLGKLPLEPAARQLCEGLGYKQPPPICIAIKRAIYNYITAEDESATSNKRSSVFNQLGNSTKRIFVFERLGPLRKKIKVWRNNKIMEASALPKSQNAPKDFQSLIPFRMRRQTNVVISCGEVLKAKSHVVVYTSNVMKMKKVLALHIMSLYKMKVNFKKM
ncbi:hypothetical protein KY290_027352 [Solanum tuberosum]|uniref:Retrotransposon gag domain-containing protein n=1 Tax=Solanum tuberosum TaxID=4113 RepID=A0ABQ7UI19_SOLTU|nr:hypothetical protein KY290_027352 [Solanum tuberosum]